MKYHKGSSFLLTFHRRLALVNIVPSSVLYGWEEMRVEGKAKTKREEREREREEKEISS